MTHCVGFDATVQLLLDGELAGEELDKARAHLATCSDCREKFEEEERLSQLIRRSRSLHSAPSSLRERISHITREASLPDRPVNDTNDSIRIVTPERRHPASTFLTRERFILIAAMLLLVLGGFLFPRLRNRSHADKLLEAAILADHGLSTNTLPLDVQSSSPKEVAAWFSGRVPFKFRLPNAGIAAEDTSKYTMVGGRLIDFRGEHAALIAFRLSGENISLLIASNRVAHAVGGTVSESDGLAFHSRQMQNHNVVTWDNQGLTYALIFSALPSGRRVCSACHEGSRVSGQSSVNKAYLANPFD